MKNYDNQIDTGAIAAPLIRMRFTFGRVTNSILDWIGLDLDYKLFASFDDRTADELGSCPIFSTSGYPDSYGMVSGKLPLARTDGPLIRCWTNLPNALKDNSTINQFFKN